MATFLFWNLNRKPLQELVVSLCHEYEVDVLILAEAQLSQGGLLEALNQRRAAKFRIPFNVSPWLLFFVKYPSKSFKPIMDEGGIAIRHLRPPIGIDLLVVALHLPSKQYQTDNDQVFTAVRVAKAIQKAEIKVGHTRTFIIGDLNMNPFESGLVGADGFHAVMDKTTAKKKSRIVQGKRRMFFYNPMWGRMGDESQGPPGTYYYNDSSHITFFWNTFDQVLIRPDLLDYFSDNRLQVITSIQGESLLSLNGTPNKLFASDHLPILVNLQIER
jgi:hypothetical protein